MFNRLQSRRANLQRFASINPANYEPFSIGQFTAYLAQAMEEKGVKVLQVQDIQSKQTRILVQDIDGNLVTVDLLFTDKQIKFQVISSDSYFKAKFESEPIWINFDGQVFFLYAKKIIAVSNSAGIILMDMKKFF
jgi:hypothetical protein